MSGLELLLRLRGRLEFPVILLTGQDAESSRVIGLDLGACDYVVKPFLPREFAARVRAPCAGRRRRRPRLHRPRPARARASVPSRSDPPSGR